MIYRIPVYVLHVYLHIAIALKLDKGENRNGTSLLVARTLQPGAPRRRQRGGGDPKDFRGVVTLICRSLTHLDDQLTWQVQFSWHPLKAPIRSHRMHHKSHY